MIVGTSDGGAHLDRDDGAEVDATSSRTGCGSGAASPSRRACGRSPDPAALCGFTDRGMLLPGYAADIMIFDPDTVGPRTKKSLAHDFPNGEARWTPEPEGVHATIVNGVPIVIDGELQADAGLPGQSSPRECRMSPRDRVRSATARPRSPTGWRCATPGPTEVVGAHRQRRACATATVGASTAPSRSRRRSCSATRARASSRRSARAVTQGEGRATTSCSPRSATAACATRATAASPPSAARRWAAWTKPFTFDGEPAWPLRQRGGVHRAHGGEGDPGRRDRRRRAARRPRASSAAAWSPAPARCSTGPRCSRARRWW